MSLNGFTTIYSKLNMIHTEEVSTTSKFTCLTCGVGRRSHCQYCMHHNIVLLKILHQSEYWCCYTPYLYVSNKICTSFNVYIFTITCWKKCNVRVAHYSMIQCQRQNASSSQILLGKRMPQQTPVSRLGYDRVVQTMQSPRTCAYSL